MSGLQYFEGAKPGKKRPNTSKTDAPSKKDRKYEENRPDRKFNTHWQENRPWLHLDADKNVMNCSICVNYYKDKPSLGSNKFIEGCSNFRKSTVTDHESTSSHKKAADVFAAEQETVEKSKAGSALLLLKQSERNKLIYLFRNIHAVAKQNRPFTDYQWLCRLDVAKGLVIGETYLNKNAAFEFLKVIESIEREKVVCLLEQAQFFSILMDGSTDISGMEQESMYIRFSKKGQAYEKFLSIDSPRSTCSSDLYQHIQDVFERTGLKKFVEKGKLVGMGSDGASNMTGSKGGLATLLRKDYPEMINIHCLCHRLELSFRDAMKSSKLYDKLMTLLTGLYYFYTKSSKQRKALQEAMTALHVKGTFPPRVTGTRWMPHLSNAISSLQKTFPAYNAQLSSASHSNAKAEGLAKIMLNKSVMAFVFVLESLLDPLMRLSLKLQQADITLADAFHWVQSTVAVLNDKKNDENHRKLQEFLDNGTFCDVNLKGPTPSLSYRDDIVDKLVSSINIRFSLESGMSIVNATRISSFKNWPLHDTNQMKDFGNEEVTTVSRHFQSTLSVAHNNFTEEEAQSEWTMLKAHITKGLQENRYKKTKQTLVWQDVNLDDFPHMCTMINLLLSLPPTSVSCETSFSQMKLIKTSRRSRLKSSTLNSLMTVKLLSESIENFKPEEAVDKWLVVPGNKRRLTYKRKSGKSTELPGNSANSSIAVSSDSDEAETVQEPPSAICVSENEDTDSDIERLFEVENCDSDYWSDFVDEDTNNKKVNDYATEE